MNIPVSLEVEPRMNLATGEDPRGLGPRDALGEEPRGGLLPLGRMLAVGRVLVTVASSAEGSGTAPQTTGGLETIKLSSGCPADSLTAATTATIAVVSATVIVAVVAACRSQGEAGRCAAGLSAYWLLP